MDEPPAKSPPEAAARPAAPDTTAKPLPPPPPPAKRRKKRGIVIALVLMVALVLVTIYYLKFVEPYETTDDAFIDGHVTLVSPRVPGLVTRLLVQDNQQVKTGDVLIELDSRDYEVRVAQARADLATAAAQLEQAKAQIVVDAAKADQQTAATAAAQAESERAAADFKRYQTVESQAVSQSQIDLAQAQARASAANVLVASNQAAAAAAQLQLSRVTVDAAAARVQQAQATLDLAELNLSYTKVTAPADGRVTERTIEAGVNVQTGQALMALVPAEVWVVANFKETQLAHMRTNQPVTFSLDAYPGREFKGHVDSLQAGTGARFSLLPAENAVGNYVKVVQRVPVKIVFDDPPDPQLDIAPGMSVEPKVKVK
jgi:membrane fusion protein (multidrug efflux system)